MKLFIVSIRDRLAGGATSRVIKASSIVEAANWDDDVVSVSETTFENDCTFARTLAMASMAERGQLVALYDVATRAALSIRTLPASVTVKRGTHDGIDGIIVSAFDQSDGRNSPLSKWYEDTNPSPTSGWMRLMSRTLPAQWNGFVDSMSISFAPVNAMYNSMSIPSLCRKHEKDDVLDMAIKNHEEKHAAWVSDQDRKTGETE